MAKAAKKTAKKAGSKAKTHKIKTVGIAGTGLIGAGWAARLLFRGYDVIAYDVSPAAEERLKAQIKTAWPSLEALLGKPKKKGKWRGNNRFKKKKKPDGPKSDGSDDYLDVDGDDDGE